MGPDGGESSDSIPTLAVDGMRTRGNFSGTIEIGRCYYSGRDVFDDSTFDVKPLQ